MGTWCAEWQKDVAELLMAHPHADGSSVAELRTGVAELRADGSLLMVLMGSWQLG